MKKLNLKYIYVVVFAALLFSSCAVFENMGSGSLDRSNAPEAGPAPTINLGSYEQFKLSNGLTVIVVENHKIPKVSYRISLDIPPILEGDKAGYSDMAGSLMQSGTQKMGKAQLSEEIDFIGASLRTSSSSVFGSSLKKHSDKLLTLMSDVVLMPTFPPEEIEKERKATLSGIASQETDVDGISGRISRAINYGLDHPYGEQSTKATIENINRNDLLDYYNTWFKPNIATLIIVGDVTKEEAKTQAETYFGAWEKGDTPSLNYKPSVPPTSNRVVFVPVNGAVQSVIRVTHPIQYSVASDDYIAAQVMNNILGGGGFSGRLLQNLREDKAYTYSTGSSLRGDKSVGEFRASASVRNMVSDSSVTQFLYEMDRIVNELVDEESLQQIKNKMNGTFALALERPETIARFAENIKNYDLPSDFYETYLTRLSQVTVADIKAAAEKYIYPNNANIVVVGNKDEVAGTLSVFSESGEVEFFDMYGNVWQDRRPAPDGITAESVLSDFISARGGENKLASIEFYSQTGVMNMMGTPLPMSMKMKGGTKIKSEFSMGGQVMMKQIVNVDKGVSIQMGQSMNMTEGEVMDAILQGDLLAELHYADYGMKADLLGIESMDGQDVYVIEVTKGMDVVSTDYYSLSTGLKLATESVSETAMGVITSKTLYKSYEEFNGVLFAKEIDITAGPQNFVLVTETMDFESPIADSEFEW